MWSCAALLGGLLMYCDNQRMMRFWFLVVFTAVPHATLFGA